MAINVNRKTHSALHASPQGFSSENPLAFYRISSKLMDDRKICEKSQKGLRPPALRRLQVGR